MGPGRFLEIILSTNESSFSSKWDFIWTTTILAPTWVSTEDFNETSSTTSHHPGPPV